MSTARALEAIRGLHIYEIADLITEIREARNTLANNLTIEAFRQDQPHLFEGVDHVQDE